MIQSLVSKYLLPFVSVMLLLAIAGAGIQSWRLKNTVTEKKALEVSLASSKATIDTMKSMEKLGRETAKRAAADKALREKDLARITNFIEGSPTDARIDPMLSDTVKRLYQSD